MRRALGTAVFAGMLGVTLFGIFLTPVFLLCDPLVHRAEVAAGASVAASERDQTHHATPELEASPG